MTSAVSQNEMLCLDSCDLGLGVFARSAIQPGKVCGYLSGKLLRFEDLVARDDLGSNSIQIGPGLYVASNFPLRFTNHSCDPNVGLTHDLRLIALRPISRNEEIRLDYSTTMFERHFTMQCQCGSPKCREIIRDFDLLPEELMKTYIEQGVVQGFIRDQLDSSEPFSSGSFRSCENEAHSLNVEDRSDKASPLVKPPGHRMRQITRLFFSKQINERVFDSIIADLREEYNESLAEGRKGHARWMRLCYTVKFWQAATSLVSSKVVKGLWMFFKGC